MNTLFAMILVGTVAINPYANVDVNRLSAEEKEHIVDQEAAIKNTGSKIHDEIE